MKMDSRSDRLPDLQLHAPPQWAPGSVQWPPLREGVTCEEALAGTERERLRLAAERDRRNARLTSRVEEWMRRIVGG
jgi:hypothetical protein